MRKVSRVTAIVCLLAATATASAGDRPNIMVTGYWPPSNEALRRFSTSAVQNPDGWVGEDWEGRGYDIHAFFPEFANPDCNSCGQGMGDFEVDYQDTSADFWPIANGLQPVAIEKRSMGSMKAQFRRP